MKKSAILLTLILLSINRAEACGQCEYKDDVLGICMTKGGCIIDSLNPIKQAGKILTLGQALAKGDQAMIKASLGEMLVNSPSCIGCLALAHNVLPQLSDSQIHSIVGEGFLTFMGTGGDPILVTVDVVQNLVRQQEIKTDEPEIPAQSSPQTQTRSKKNYTLVSSCLIEKKGDPNVYAAWRGPASFISSDGLSHTHPDVDLAKGDSLVISAPLCPQMDDAAHGQKSIETATLSFKAVTSLAGGPDVLKWWISGTRFEDQNVSR